jgi:hypothetical protein
MSKRQRFRAEVIAEKSTAYVDVPTRVSEAFASYAKSRRIAVAGKVRGVLFHATLVPRRGGGHRLYLNQGTRRPARIEIGDVVPIELTALREAGTDVPSDLAAWLRRVHGAKGAFDALSPSHRRELIRYIEDAKTSESRRSRIERTALAVVGRLPKSKSSLKSRPLWTCPKCRHEFVNPNQYRSCRRYELDDVMRGKPPRVRRAFEKFREMVLANGPATMQVYRDRIGFMVRVRFAGATPRKKWLEIGFWLSERIEHPRFVKVETITPNAHVHRVRVLDEHELDDEVAAWLAEAYAVGCQEHLA